MKPTETDSYSIDRVRQVRALAAPARQEILDALQVAGPTTVAALGAMLGRAPDSLYHHIKVLVREGLVRKVATRRKPFTREAVYGIPGRTMQIAYDLEDPAMTDAVNAVVRAMTRISYRDFERAAKRGEAVVHGPRRNLRGARIKGMLDTDQIQEINRLYQRIVEIMTGPPRDSDGSRLHVVTFVMSPLADAAVPPPGESRPTRRRK